MQSVYVAEVVVVAALGCSFDTPLYRPFSMLNIDELPQTLFSDLRTPVVASSEQMPGSHTAYTMRKTAVSTQSIMGV